MNKNVWVFIAEDDIDDYSFFESAVNEVAPQVRINWAKDGEELLNTLEKTNDDSLPCLIVLDYNMPRVNGLQAAKFLQEKDRYENIPKVFYSNAIYKDHIAQALAAGSVAFFEKGHTVEEIKEEVHKMLTYCKIIASTTS